MKFSVALLPGDGIGPEVLIQAVKVLEAIAEKYGHEFIFEQGLVGAAAIDAVGVPLPESSLKLCQDSDAILFGAIGDPRFDKDPTARVRPEQGLLELRKALGLFANLRPVKSYAGLVGKSPLKEALVNGIDFIIYRELTGGLYFGEKVLDT
jgi:3-isopropylmalate dehydrogenase